MNVTLVDTATDLFMVLSAATVVLYALCKMLVALTNVIDQMKKVVSGSNGLLEELRNFFKQARKFTRYLFR